MSIGANTAIVLCMTRTLRQFVTKRREELGLNQTQLGEKAGVPRTTINRIEKGTTQLPEADVRRKLARALGVTHIQILLEAGELTEDEAGPQAPPPFTADDPRAEVVTIMRRMSDADVRNLRALALSVVAGAPDRIPTYEELFGGEDT